MNNKFYVALSLTIITVIGHASTLRRPSLLNLPARNETVEFQPLPVSLIYELGQMDMDTLATLFDLDLTEDDERPAKAHGNKLVPVPAFGGRFRPRPGLLGSSVDPVPAFGGRSHPRPGLLGSSAGSSGCMLGVWCRQPPPGASIAAPNLSTNPPDLSTTVSSPPTSPPGFSSAEPSPPTSSPSAPPTIRWNKDLQEVERMRSLKTVACTPRKTPVAIPAHADPLIIYQPSCVLVDRCGGCCNHELLECLPVPGTGGIARKKVLALKLTRGEDGQVQLTGTGALTKVRVERHTACVCSCKVRAVDCSSDQVYDSENCKCRCVRPSVCKELQIWSEKDCHCTCREIKECSTGSYFNPDTCGCVTLTDLRMLQTTREGVGDATDL